MTSQNTETRPASPAKNPATDMMAIVAVVRRKPMSILSVGRKLMPSRDNRCQNMVTGGSRMMMNTGLSP